MIRKGKKKLRKRALSEDEDENAGQTQDDVSMEDLIKHSRKSTQHSQKAMRGASFAKIKHSSASERIEDYDDTEGASTTQTAFNVSSDGSATRNTVGNDATAQLDIDSADGRERYKQQMEQQTQKDKGPVYTEDGKKIYKGESNYTDFIKRDADSMHSAKMRGTLGPVRGPSHIRTSNQVDYEPSICKDYYETGFCGYGDTCIFLHMRESFTPGWKLDQQWEEEQKKKQSSLERKVNQIVGDEDENDDKNKDEEEKLPFACFICRKQWSDKEANLKPVKTLCGHYFCETCALKRHKRDTSCAACNKETYGMFNLAQEISDKYQSWKGERPKPASGGGGWGAVTTIKSSNS